MPARTLTLEWTTQPHRGLRFTLKSDPAGASTTSSSTTTSIGSAPDPHPLQVDFTPLPIPADLAHIATAQRDPNSNSLDIQLAQALLLPLLRRLRGAGGGADAPSLQQLPPLQPDYNMRTLQLTGVELVIVKQQHATVKAAMRLLKAWVYYGSHGVDETQDLPGSVCEVVVMAACSREQLCFPNKLAEAGLTKIALTSHNSANNAGRVPEEGPLFLAALKLMSEKFRVREQAPFLAEVLYTREEAERCREWCVVRGWA